MISVCALQIMALNESPVLLLLDPTPQPGQRDLPVRLFESGATVTASFFPNDRGITQAVKHPTYCGRRTAARKRGHKAADDDSLLPHIEPGAVKSPQDLLSRCLTGAELHVKDGAASFSFVQANFHIEVRFARSPLRCAC